MKIALIEPFYSGSHKKWADGLKEFSQHNIELFTLPGRLWKWRMSGGAVDLARQFMESNFSPELILATDMLDLSTFLSLTRTKSSGIKTVLYFHENQITYPWSPDDQDPDLSRDHHYGFINYTSALSADHCFFNSDYHRNNFITHLKPFLRQFPDKKNLGSVDLIMDKSSTLYLGLDLHYYLNSNLKNQSSSPIILWNHRWEYDKNFDGFANACKSLVASGFDFKLIVLGERTNQYADEFDQFYLDFQDRIIHFGFVESLKEYQLWVQQANILLVTSHQDFFGGSVVEAIAAGCIPILPNRLAYTEHIPGTLQDLYLYKDSDDLTTFIMRAWSQSSSDQINDLRQHVARYHWENIISSYDNMFIHVFKN